MRRAAERLAALAALFAPLVLPVAAQGAAPACARPVYLTFDTGHMGVADHIAAVLKRQGVRATFFLASERTREGGSSLDERWAPWWRERAAEGHAFGSHTWDHGSWLRDRADGGFDLRPSQGPQAGRTLALSPAAYCAELARPAARFEAITGRPMAALFRAPGGKTSPKLLAAAQHCGWTHVGWSAAGFLGDELSSRTHPNADLLARALRDIRAGDVLMAHLGIWSREDPWAPAVLEPLIEGLKARGFCFEPLSTHPAYAAAAGRSAPR